MSFQTFKRQRCLIYEHMNNNNESIRLVQMHLLMEAALNREILLLTLTP